MAFAAPVVPAALRSGPGKTWRERPPDLSWQTDPADYISRWAQPPPPRERLEAQRGIPVRPSSNLFWASSVVGDIIVLEGDDGYAERRACPAPNQSQQCTYFIDNNIFSVADQVMRFTDDSHDEIVIWTTFAQNGAGYAAFYLPLSNDIAGLGDCNQSRGESQGCIYDNWPGVRVQGLIYMSSVGSWRELGSWYDNNRPVDDLGHMVYGGIGHETIHRWLAALRFVDPASGQVSKQMLGESLCHWHPAVDGAGGMLYGWDWDEQSPGTFELLAESVRYNDLELYAMGALPPDSVRDWFLIQNGQSPELATVMRDFGYSISSNISSGPGLFIQIPPVDYLDKILTRYYQSYAPHITATGDRLDLWIDDVLAAEGPRVPEYGLAPTTVRQVWVLVTAPGQTIAQAGSAISELEIVRQNFPRWFTQASRGTMRVCAQLAGDCPAPALEAQNARFDDSTSSNNAIADPGESIDYWPIAFNSGNQAAHGVKAVATGVDPNLAIDRSESLIGDVEAGVSAGGEQSLLVFVDGKAECGVPQRFDLGVQGDDTPELKQRQVVYTGLKRIDGTDFESGDDGWQANPTGNDDASSGAFVSGVSTTIYAGKSRITPAGQTTAGGAWAMLTAPSVGRTADESDVDNGSVSVQSRAYSIDGLKEPHLGYRYWHVAVDSQGAARTEENNQLLVEISSDGGNSFKQLAQHLDNTRLWEVAVIRLRDVFKQEMPKQVVLRFSQQDYDTDEVVEAGVDDVAIYDLAGKCTPAGCGCVSADLEPSALLLGALALLGWRRSWRRRS